MQEKNVEKKPLAKLKLSAILKVKGKELMRLY